MMQASINNRYRDGGMKNDSNNRYRDGGMKNDAATLTEFLGL